MKTAGIICEFNPFHNGHRYLIEEARAGGADCVICVMSGHVTQRGEVAIADKFTRAEMAVRCGADLVLELPFPYSASGAQYFAEAGVYLLNRLAVDEIVFGSECGDVACLTRVARYLYDNPPPADDAHRGSAAAHFAHLQKALGEGQTLLSNDILGVEYLLAILRQQASMRPRVIKRLGADYRDDEIPDVGFASASGARKSVWQGQEEALTRLMPTEALSVWRRAVVEGEAPVEPTALSDAILSYFRLRLPSELAGFAEMAGGLENRLCRAAHESRSLAEFFEACATKKYTHARIRRAVWFAMTGVRECDLRARPAYTNLLAASACGKRFLRGFTSAPDFAVLTKGADYRTLGAEACRQAALSLAADTLFSLGVPRRPLPGEYIKRKAFFLS